MAGFVSVVCCLVFAGVASAQTKCWLAVEGGRTIAQEGDCDAPHPPNSTFKLALAVMGFESGALEDASAPELPYREGYPVIIDQHAQAHSPASWMKYSVVWYSQWLTRTLGMARFQGYVDQLGYGNRDLTGEVGKDNGLTNAWLSSSLKISGREQVGFVSALAVKQLNFSDRSQRLTRDIAFLEELPGGYKLYGKTGAGNLRSVDGTPREEQFGWFVGWVEKDEKRVVFAHYVEDTPPPGAWAGPIAREAAKQKLQTLINNKSI